MSEKTNDELLAEILAAQTYDERIAFARFFSECDEHTPDYIASAISAWVEDNLPADEQEQER